MRSTAFRRKALDKTISSWHDCVVLGAQTDALAARLEEPELSALLERERARFTARIVELELERDIGKGMPQGMAVLR